MPHPLLDNQTPFAVLPLLVADEEARPLVVPVLKATYCITRHGLRRAAEQLPVSVTGEYYGDPQRSSVRYEPETAWRKVATDVALIGHAYARSTRDTQVDVTLQVGPVGKSVRVVGDRVWVKRLGIVDMTNPQPFEQIPLVYERAFGGWDAAEPDPISGSFEPANPVGVGYRRKHFDEGMPLPNLEDPKRQLRMYGDRPPPTGFGFIAPHWQPRAAFAGTYDEAWKANRAPRLPLDFRPEYFSAAAPGLRAAEYLRGDERVTVENVTPQSPLEFNLPGPIHPQVRLELRAGKDVQLPMPLDTVIVNTDEMLVLLLWRAHHVLPGGPHDLKTIEVRIAS